MDRSSGDGDSYGWLVVVVVEDVVLDFGVSFMPSSNSFFTLFLASLNSRIPRPRPFMNSGIFLPPNKIKTARIISIHSEPPGADNKNMHCRKWLNIYLLFKDQR